MEEEEKDSEASVVATGEARKVATEVAEMVVVEAVVAVSEEPLPGSFRQTSRWWRS